MNIPLPQVRKVSLIGFEPIFSSQLDFQIEKLLFILLGVNGIGKTTILQSIVYCLGGPADANIEGKESKERRWDRHYFKDRLSHSERARVEVTFMLGSEEICIVRGFKNDNLLKLIINDDIISDDVRTAENLFADYLRSYTAYASLADFYFVIHKLCYLSEDRKDLAWDIEAQTRILMMMFADPSVEHSFRERRIELKEIDSKIRHSTVNVNRLEKMLRQFEEAKEEVGKGINEELVQATSSRAIEEIQRDFLESNKMISLHRAQEKNYRNQLNTISAEIDSMRDELAAFENSFILEKIGKIESKETQLAIHKLLHNKICPACGCESEALHMVAVQNFKHSKCALCSRDEKIKKTKALPAIEAEINEKLKIKLSIEQEIRKINGILDALEMESGKISSEINKYFINKPQPVIFIDKLSAGMSEGEIAKIREAYQVVLDAREFQRSLFEDLKNGLERDYELYSKRSFSAIDRLSILYKKYASEFLGADCTLEPSQQTSRLISLKLFVPKFNEQIRDSPDSCSEAQRFFLDIAFRMALIQLAGEGSNSMGTFICETPENALDITYKDNVADMFEMFSKKNKNTLIISCNVQSEGIAHSLLKKIGKPEIRQMYYMNLLEHGSLSHVQSSIQGKRLLNKELNKIRK